jgi:hypothetical protein
LKSVVVQGVVVEWGSTLVPAPISIVQGTWLSWLGLSPQSFQTPGLGEEGNGSCMLGTAGGQHLWGKT